jgi:hypothetical protein
VGVKMLAGEIQMSRRVLFLFTFYGRMGVRRAYVAQESML